MNLEPERIQIHGRMDIFFESVILKATGASVILATTPKQDLWSGYRKLMRVNLMNAAVESVVVKLVEFPLQRNHPRGWNTDIGHQRILKSYHVESNWYACHVISCQAGLPRCPALEKQGKKVLMVREDLDLAGFPLRKVCGPASERVFKHGH